MKPLRPSLLRVSLSRSFRCIPVAALGLALVTTPPLSPAQGPGAQSPQADTDNPSTWSQPDTLRIIKEVRHRLLSLPYYGVFDSLRFAIKGRTIVLEGEASRPVLKSEAANAVKSIPGVESVDNQIDVLPNSPNDDRIRAAVYRRIYSQPALRQYTGSPVGFGRFPSVARMAGGITQDPPTGFHAIHIIVKNGNVTLQGVVDNEMAVTIAGMQANMTSGVFSVDNDLQIAGKPPKTAAK